MNNIGFAATKNTAATNNNTATPAASSLGVLANNFSSSSNALSGNFNTLILGLFIQIIQTLLKNLQNKPCCDQPPKPTDKPLDLSDTQLNKLDKLPSLGKTEPGSDPTIKSVIDTDGNNQLSVGDRVNLEQVTDQLDANGQAIIKTSTKTLTTNDLSIYNSLKAPNQLSDADTERVQSAINQLGGVGANGAPQATGCYYDNDTDGKLSIGDQVEALIFTDVSGAPPTDGSYRVAKKTVDEAFLENYNNTNTSTPLTLNNDQLTNLWIGSMVAWNSADPSSLKVFDTDKNGQLNAGDTLSASIVDNTNTPPLWTHQLTENEANVINGNYGKTLGPYTSSLLTTSDLPTNPPNPANEALAKALDLDTEDGEYLRVVYDKDGNGKLSAGDIALTDHNRATADTGIKPPRFATGSYIELSAEVVEEATKTDKDIPLSKAEQTKLLDVVAIGTGSINAPSLIGVKDTDGNRALSVGDVVARSYFSGQVDENTGEAIYRYSFDPLTTEQFGNYQKLTMDADLLDITSQEQGWLTTAYANTNNPSNDKTTNVFKVVYDTDNSGDVSVGDAVGTRQYLGEGNPTADGPYDVGLRNVDQELFTQYQLAKEAGSKFPGTKGE